MAELEFDFDAAMSTVSYHNLTFGYMTDVANGSTYVALDTISYQLYSNGYSHHEIYLAQYGTIPANARLAFCYSGTSSSSYYAFVDNIRVRIAPSCIRPQNVTVDNIDMNGATISCLAPMAKTLNDTYPIVSGIMTTSCAFITPCR